MGTVTNSPNSFLNGGDGQNESGSLAYGSGGFGGGAAGSERKGGAAGGYSGGGTISTEGTAGHYGTGGSGGSYILSSATNIATSNGLYNNSSSFNGASITNLNSYNAGHGKVTITLLSAPATIELDRGLVAHYPMDNNSKDVIGGNDLIVNGASLSADRFAHLNQSYFFDGGDNLTSTDTISISGNDNRTMVYCRVNRLLG